MSGGSGFTVYNPLATTPTGLRGLPVIILDDNGYVVARRIIRSNTTTVLTIYGTWGNIFVDNATYHYRVGYIYWYVQYERMGFINGEFRKGFKELEAVYDYSGNEAEDNKVYAQLSYPTPDGLATGAPNRVYSDTYHRDSVIIRAHNATIRGRFARVVLSGVTRIRTIIREIVLTFGDLTK
jgi:hypothetical protein